MLIELKGVGTQNKGAHLMLVAIMQEFRKRNIAVNFCVEPGFGMDYQIAKELGMYLKYGNLGKKALINRALFFLPRVLRRRLNLVIDREVDIILDASGFAFGDFWGYEKPLKRFDNLLKNKLNRGVKTVLMPQALGPFREELVRKSFQKIVERADLVFVRDKHSFGNMIEAYGEQDKFFLAPDFTNLVEAGSEIRYPEGDVCVIPNYKMLLNDKEFYIDFLKDVIEMLIKANANYYFLIHEGEKDKQIALELNQLMATNSPIVVEEDPIKIKNRIKSSRLVVVSRFHGLVSALSQGVPAISTSWSHKYKLLMEEYGQLDSLVDVRNYDKAKVQALVAHSLEDGFRGRFRESQKSIIEREKGRAKAMWDKVFGLIS